MRLTIDQKLLQQLVNQITLKPTNIYCEVVPLINSIQEDVKPVEEPATEP